MILNMHQFIFLALLILNHVLYRIYSTSIIQYVIKISVIINYRKNNLCSPYCKPFHVHLYLKYNRVPNPWFREVIVGQYKPSNSAKLKIGFSLVVACKHRYISGINFWIHRLNGNYQNLFYDDYF